MYMHGEQVIKELQSNLTETTGCIIFDFACYFPYSNQDVLSFDFQLGSEKFTDIKMNHRYPNHSYVTLSKRNGRSVSKIGYPYFLPLTNKEQTFLLTVNIDIREEESIHLVFPLSINLSKEHPVCALALKFDFDSGNFTFTSHKRCKDGGWIPIMWTNNSENKYLNYSPESIIFMDTPKTMDNNTLIYGTVLTPVPETMDTVLI